MERLFVFYVKEVLLVPSVVNIGVHDGAGARVVSGATIGSFAVIGKHGNITVCAGGGGVREPREAASTIIEDQCVVGARSEVVEGLVVGPHSVVGMGVF